MKNHPHGRGLRTGDVVLGSLAGFLAAAYVVIALQDSTGSDILRAILSVGFAAAIFVWRSRPRLSACAFLGLLGGWAAGFLWALPAHSGITPWIITAPMAVAVAARYDHNRGFARGVFVACAAGSFLSPLIWAWDESLVVQYRTGLDLVFTVAVHWLVLGFAYVVGIRYRARETEQQLREAARQEQLRAVQEAERLHLAREIHDALAHSLTLIKVQADAGLIASRSDPHQAEQALVQVQDSAASALRDVRDIVEMLRDDSPTGHSLSPGPQLSDLPDTVDKFRQAGLSITAELPTDVSRVTTVATVTQLAIDRVITEALNNVVRHQGPTSSAHVSVTLTEAQALVNVSSRADDGAAASHCTEGTGMGIASLAERVRLLGGRFTAEEDGAEFVVSASLPLRPASEKK